MNTKNSILFYISNAFAVAFLVLGMITSMSVELSGIPRPWVIEWFYPQLISNDGTISMSGSMLQSIKSDILTVTALAIAMALTCFVIAQKQSRHHTSQVN
jgi:hypothetical protein